MTPRFVRQVLVWSTGYDLELCRVGEGHTKAEDEKLEEALKGNLFLSPEKKMDLDDDISVLELEPNSREG